MTHQTVFLARLFGLGITIVSVGMLIDEPGLSATIQLFVHDRPATLMLSLVCIASGLAVVLSHQIWSGGIAPILITLLGWILLIRGVILLVLPPNLLESFADALVGRPWVYAAGVVALVIGLILTYAGFRAPPIVSARQ
jgi:hypothetical protein